MKRIWTTLALLGCLYAVPNPSFGQAEPNLIEPFLKAVSSKDRAKLRAFVDANFHSSLSTDQWVERLWDFVKNAAPLKLIKLVEAGKTSQKAEFEDKNGQRWGMRLGLAGDPPKINMLQISDPESLDSPPPKDYTGWKDLASLAAAVRKDADCPAIGIAVWQEGKPLEVVVDGVRVLGKPERVQPDDIWHIGSIGKSITSTLIGRLIEMGKLRWDMTLKEAFPEVRIKPGYEGATLEQIMHHRGGIPQDMGFSQEQVDAICGDETDPVKIRERYVRNVLGREPIAKPGERFAYSNAGYALLGHLAEKVMGKPFEALTEDVVFAPLGMKTARVGKSDLPGAKPSGHVKGDKGLEPFNLGGKLGVLIAPAGDMSCSVGDLARFAKMHVDALRGKHGLLKSETVKRLHDPIPESPGGPGYACGWSVGRLPGTSLGHGHNGSNGTFRAEMAVFPKEGLVVVAIVNRGGEYEPSPPLQAVLAVARRYAPASAK